MGHPELLFGIELCLCGRCEAVASAHGAHFEVKRSMLRMTAVIEECFRSLLAGVYLRQRRGCWMGLTEVNTKSALTLIDCDHTVLLCRL